MPRDSSFYCIIGGNMLLNIKIAIRDDPNMTIYIKKILLSVTVFWLSGSLNANRLTPPDEPKDDSFYICYEKRCPNTVTASPPVLMIPGTSYTQLKYVGCMISQIPCEAICDDKFKAHPIKLKQFSWANNYPQALNAFYRCAYSG